MENDLKVIQPFYPMDLNDVFKYDEKSNTYVSNYGESDDKSSYTMKCTLSLGYAKKLVKDGFLKELKNINKLELCKDCSDNSEARAQYYQKKYVDLRQEIDTLHTKYVKAIANPNNDNEPKCLQVEQETVLKNLEKVTRHLLEFGDNESKKSNNEEQR